MLTLLHSCDTSADTGVVITDLHVIVSDVQVHLHLLAEEKQRKEIDVRFALEPSLKHSFQLFSLLRQFRIEFVCLEAWKGEKSI